MLAGALRRFLGLLLLAGGLTAVASLALGAALGAPPQRSISLGFYLTGSFLLVSGFFVGNRGPVRPRSDTEGGVFGGLIPVPFGNRRLRWATAAEHQETINLSAVFVSLGVALILLGVAIDSRVDLV